ncbi:MAG: hypothetical protein HKP61_16665 [Dactylosporangium sp.]|nr:hypothetical protein [Dactylosporangium sp.]
MGARRWPGAVGRWVPAGLVVGVAGLAGWALLADAKTGWAVGTGVVAAVAGAFSPSVVDRWRARRQDGIERRRALSDHLVADLPASVTWLLRADQEVVAFFGRGWVLRQLSTWCDDDADAVRLITAPGGYGKTRLARHFVARLSGWGHWPVAVGSESAVAAVVTAGEVPDRLVITVDYADSRPAAGLAQLLYAAGRPGRGRVRLLLLARAAGPWWTDLSEAYPGQGALVDALTTDSHVIDLPARADERPPQQIIDSAMTAFAQRLHRRPPANYRPGRHDPDTTLLRLHTEALLAVLGTPTGRDGTVNVLDEVLKHECRYWRGRARRVMLALPDDPRRADLLCRRLVGLAALLGADDDAEVAGIIRRVPDLADADRATVDTYVAWLRTLYPAEGSERTGRLGTLQPDLLAEYLAVDALAGLTPQHRTAVFTGLATARAVRALTVLGRATAHRPDAQQLIDAALAVDPVMMTGAVVEIATRFPGMFAARCARLLATAETDLVRLIGLAERVPHPSLELGCVGLVLAGRILDHPDLAGSSPDRGTWLTWYAVRLAEAGRRPEALEASAEAVTLRRELAAGNRDAYLPDLAMSVNNHAVRLAEAGRRPEALEASAEAVTLRRELAAGNRDAYLPDLAGSVNNHAVALAEAGRRPEALEASAEAVTLYRELAAGNRDAYLPNLAMSLWMTGRVCLEVSGPLDRAAAASSEAVRLFVELAAVEPDAFTGRLRAAAGVLADVHDARGAPEEAVEVRTRYGIEEQ